LWGNEDPVVGLEGRDFAIAIVELEKKIGEIPEKFPKLKAQDSETLRSTQVVVGGYPME